MEQRRRAERQPVSHRGMCRIENYYGAEWHDCRLIDISRLGLGIRIEVPYPDRLVGSRIIVEIPPIGDSVDIRLAGQIKDAVLIGTEGAIRVGVEFDTLSPSERAVVDIVAQSAADLRERIRAR